MALDNGYNVNKQLPQYPDGTPLMSENHHPADDWSMDKVIEWLEAHGWGSVAPLFERKQKGLFLFLFCYQLPLTISFFFYGGGLIYLVNEIQGQAFLDLTMTKLAKVIPRSDLAYGDKRRLLHGIHSIQASHGNQQQQQQQQQHTIMVRKQEDGEGLGQGLDI
jgi:hypothetical protein